MRKGWKTRIDERKYFENKKQEREDRAIFIAMMRQKMENEMHLHLEQMRANHEIN